MSWLTTLFSGGVSKVVDSVGGVIDELVTSDEEREQLKVKIQKELNNFQISQLESLARYDAEVTARHKADMASDSWLSKNIRPMALAFLTVSTVLLAYLTIFMLPVDKVPLIDPWQELLKLLLITAYGFYFGSRGLEKVKTISLDKKQKTGGK